MKKREAAKNNVQAEGFKVQGALKCNVCPLINDGCAGHLGASYCLAFSKNWLVCNQEKSDWKVKKTYSFPIAILDKEEGFSSGNKKLTAKIDGEVLTIREYSKRHTEPKAPSHEEIMTLWFFVEGTWVKVVNYIPENKACYGYTDIRDNESYWATKGSFENAKSAIIPPEAE